MRTASLYRVMKDCIDEICGTHGKMKKGMKQNRLGELGIGGRIISNLIRVIEFEVADLIEQAEDKVQCWSSFTI
jgi:hypothetical protein